MSLETVIQHNSLTLAICTILKRHSAWHHRLISTKLNVACSNWLHWLPVHYTGTCACVAYPAITMLTVTSLRKAGKVENCLAKITLSIVVGTARNDVTAPWGKVAIWQAFVGFAVQFNCWPSIRSLRATAWCCYELCECKWWDFILVSAETYVYRNLLTLAVIDLGQDRENLNDCN